MKPFRLFALLCLALAATPVLAAPQIGVPAPDFTTTDSAGKSVALSALKGKTVVLEWTNPECPFVKKFYEAGAMQNLQKQATDAGVIWISINSSASGKQGHLTAESAQTLVADQQSAASHYVLDSEGMIGHLYEARTTPHMFVINTKGELAYMGAIDDKPSVDSADIPTATNYVTQALAELKESKAVSVPSTKPYGCGVKY